MKKAREILVGVFLVSLTASGCTRQAPDPEDFGYKLDSQGKVVIAYPLRCPDDEREWHGVYGASAYVEGKNGFDVLWSAREPRNAKVRDGLFVVGDGTSFMTEEKPLKGELPGEFFVGVTERRADGRESQSVDGYVNLSLLDDAVLESHEYMTYTGRVMTRAEIDAQWPCSRPGDAS